MPCCMEKINLIARKYKINVIEDSAQSILTEYNGKKIGNSNLKIINGVHDSNASYLYFKNSNIK